MQSANQPTHARPTNDYLTRNAQAHSKNKRTTGTNTYTHNIAICAATDTHLYGLRAAEQIGLLLGVYIHDELHSGWYILLREHTHTHMVEITHEYSHSQPAIHTRVCVCTCNLYPCASGGATVHTQTQKKKHQHCVTIVTERSGVCVHVCVGALA